MNTHQENVQVQDSVKMIDSLQNAYFQTSERDKQGGSPSFQLGFKDFVSVF